VNTGVPTHNAYNTQAAANPPVVNQPSRTAPGTQQFGADISPTTTAAQPTAGLPGYNQGLPNTAPSTGQKLSASDIYSLSN
jgi:hypothetical protein